MIKRYCLRLFVSFVVMTLSLSLSIGAFAADPKVSDIRIGSNSDMTKFVIDLNKQVNFTYMLLENPYRIVVDLPSVDWSVEGKNGRAKGQGLIKGYRFGQYKKNVSRLVIDLTQPAVVIRTSTLPPSGAYGYRIAIDMEKATAGQFKTAMKGGIVKSNTDKKLSASVSGMPQRNGKRVIVLDPGHGGRDPGKPSVIGVAEKDIALSMGKVLKRELEATGRYKVILTRTTDVLIAHRKRFQVARRNNADLFISLHGDSIANNSIRGATVYTLSERASDQEAAALARRENKSDLLIGVDLNDEPEDVSNILIDLAQRETMNYSARFANYLVPELKKNMRVNRNPHRSASLLVLKAADVPSVLLEMGYLTNRADARFLNSRDGQKKMSRSILVALDNYFKALSLEGY